MYRILLIIFLIGPCFLYGQVDSSFLIRDISVEGNQRTSEDAIIILSGLKINDWVRVPGPKVNKAVKILWESGDFKDIRITKKRLFNGIAVVINVEEYYLLGDVKYGGLSKSEVKKMEQNPAVMERKFYKPQTLNTIKYQLKKLLDSKGYINHDFSIDSIRTMDNFVNFQVNVEKGSRYRVSDIGYKNNQDLKQKKLSKSLENIHTRKYLVIPGNIYENNAVDELANLKQYARNNGYPYATAHVKNVAFVGTFVLITYELKNMDKYRIGKFIWEGNTLFSDSLLNAKTSKILGKDYGVESLEKHLYYNDKFSDISSMHYDKGYASSIISHRLIPGDNGVMDVEVKINEGKEMHFGNIKVVGNVRTKESVILREILTQPGDVFSRTQILYSQQKLMQLEYFDAAKMDVAMVQDTSLGLVNLTYIVGEKIGDQLLLSGGFDGYKLVGTLGFNFKNFSAKDVFKKGSKWNPLPAGGGQHLSLKAQSDGQGYYGFSFSFYEPWLRNKPIGLSFNNSFANIKDSVGNLNVLNIGTTISHKPFKNKFTYLNYELSYKRYNAYNYNVFGETTGHFNALSLQLGLLKNTTDNGYFPTKGIYLKGTALTSLPPFSRFTEDAAEGLTTTEKFNWFEFYKLKLSIKKYIPLDKKRSWVVASSAGAGYLGSFNKNIGIVPFQRFEMGGTGLTNYSITTNEFIGLRGYEPDEISSADGDPIAVKYSLELRKRVFQLNNYMLSTHAFFEGGSTLSNLSDLNINNLNNAVGVGAKLYAPIIGVIGIDVGWGYNKANFDWKIPTVQFTLGLNIGDF